MISIFWGDHPVESSRDSSFVITMVSIKIDSDLGGTRDWWVQSDGVLLLCIVTSFNVCLEPLAILVLLPRLSIVVLYLNSCWELIRLAMITSLLVDELRNLPSFGFVSREFDGPLLRLSRLRSVVVDSIS